MTGVVIGLCGAVIAAAAVGLVRIRVERLRRERQVRQVRGTELYAHLYPILIRCDRRHVESVAIRATDVSIHLYQPAGRRLRFTFEKQGFDQPEPDTLYALAQAVMVDMPSLRDADHYDFQTHTAVKANGERVRWYEYVVRTEYKDRIMQAMRGKQRQGT